MKLLTVLLLAFWILPSTVFADWAAGAQEISVHGGMALPLNSLEANPGSAKAKTGGPGLAVGGEYLFHVLPQIAFGLDIDYFKLGQKSSGAFLVNTDATANAKSTLLLGVAKYSLVTEGRAFLPYVLGGVGLHVSTLKLEGTPAAGAEWSDTNTAEERGLMDDTRSSVALAVGAGTDIMMTPHTSWGLEARYVYLGSVDYSPTQSGRVSGLTNISGSEHLVQLLVKAGLQF